MKKYYLAGGTALSLYFGHRFSYDLDFFSQTSEKSAIIVSSLKDKGRLEIFQNDEGTFNGVLNSVKLSFFIYPYPLIKKSSVFKGIQIACVEDITCMKLDAISSRGTKRDFIDLYKICTTKFSLPQILRLFEKKYEGVKYNVLHILKSLMYFEDAENNEMPKMIEKIKWTQVKNFFLENVPKLIK